MVTKLGKMMIYLEVLLHKELLIPLVAWYFEIMWKLKPLHLSYRNAYGHQNWKDNNSPWGTATHQFLWPFDNVVLQDHMTN